MTTKTCVSCRNPITEYERSIKVSGESFHWEHFTCDVCKNPLGVEDYFEKNGKRYCERDYRKAFSVMCYSCQQPIFGERVSAIEKDFHSDCFRCCDCKVLLSGKFYRKNGLPSCASCHLGNCGKCKLPLTGDCVEACATVFHSECFVCKVCENPISGKFYSEEKLPVCFSHDGEPIQPKKPTTQPNLNQTQSHSHNHSHGHSHGHSHDHSHDHSQHQHQHQHQQPPPQPTSSNNNVSNNQFSQPPPPPPPSSSTTNHSFTQHQNQPPRSSSYSQKQEPVNNQPTSNNQDKNLNHIQNLLENQLQDRLQKQQLNDNPSSIQPNPSSFQTSTSQNQPQYSKPSPQKPQQQQQPQPPPQPPQTQSQKQVSTNQPQTQTQTQTQSPKSKPICVTCNQEILRDLYEFQRRCYHPEHLQCTICGIPLLSPTATDEVIRIATLNGKPVCRRCLNE